MRRTRRGEGEFWVLFWVLVVLAGVGLLVYCLHTPTLTEGTVDAHGYEAPYTSPAWVQIIPIHSGKTTTLIPIVHPAVYHPARYFLKVSGEVDGKRVENEVTTNSDYEGYAVGSRWTAKQR